MSEISQPNRSLGVAIIKASHTRHRKLGSFRPYLTKSKEELLQFALEEMDLKNQAYYFILEKGHFQSFADYCRNKVNNNLTLQVQS